MRVGRSILVVLVVAGASACSGPTDGPDGGATEGSDVTAVESTVPAPATTGATAPDTAAGPTTTGRTPTDGTRIRAVDATELGASWSPGCPVGPAELRAVEVTHVLPGGGTGSGTIVVHADVADDVAGVFDVLRSEGFPIDRVRPIADYDGDDDRSMTDNNTSGFNCRRTVGGSRWSDHAYGLAVDVNPRWNPYVGQDGTVLPPIAAPYVDRSDLPPGGITPDGPVVAAFAEIGWSWGGWWSAPDHQHFSARGG